MKEAQDMAQGAKDDYQKVNEGDDEVPEESWSLQYVEIPVTPI